MLTDANLLLCCHFRNAVVRKSLLPVTECVFGSVVGFGCLDKPSLIVEFVFESQRISSPVIGGSREFF